MNEPILCFGDELMTVCADLRQRGMVITSLDAMVVKPSGWRVHYFERDPITDTAMKSLEINGHMVLMDCADFEMFDPSELRVRKVRNKWYCHSAKTGLLIHRTIMGAKSGQMVDHENGNGLDNQRNNLRFCTNSQNQPNSNPQSHLQFKGIYESHGRFNARIKVEGVRISLGSFTNARDAAIAYDKAAIEKFGEYARTNFNGRVAKTPIAPGGSNPLGVAGCKNPAALTNLPAPAPVEPTETVAHGQPQRRREAQGGDAPCETGTLAAGNSISPATITGSNMRKGTEMPAECGESPHPESIEDRLNALQSRLAASGKLKPSTRTKQQNARLPYND